MSGRYSHDNAPWLVPLGEQEWRKHGACYGDPEAQLFDLEVEGENPQQKAHRVKKAIGVCETACPDWVRRECRAAVDPRIDTGVRGGELLGTKRRGPPPPPRA